ncbi:MAG: hypothetical protein Q9167_005423 [Letrouitia subvulpina]
MPVSSQNAGKCRVSETDDSVTANASKKSKSTSPYDSAFEQHLKDHWIFPHRSLNDGVKPLNLASILACLSSSRRSVSPSQLHDSKYEDFKGKVWQSRSEGDVTATVIPVITGTTSNLGKRNRVFTKLKPLTDGTLTMLKPDYYEGSRPEALSYEIRQKLGGYIVPSSDETLPCLPNFFLEVKAYQGDLVGERQVCYDGAMGCRAVHKLRQLINPETAFDCNSYTLSFLFHNSAGTLKAFAHYALKSTDPKHPVEFRMTQISAWVVDDNAQNFREALRAFRNGSDWAANQRAVLIAAANSIPPN